MISIFFFNISFIHIYNSNKIIGLWLLIENSFGNNTRNLREYVKIIMQKYGRIPGMGEKRFTQIHHAIDPTIEELIELTSLLCTFVQQYVFLLY